LGFDCKSRVAEKTVNTKEKKKQAIQEKRKRKDDKTDTDPQKKYRGNDQFQSFFVMVSSLGSFVLLIDVASLLGSFVPLLGVVS
jgi:hypothetical protein